MTRAVREGLGTLTHASSVYFNEPQLRLAARLAETFDAPLSRSLFIQSGADSNEAAVLFARRATGRSGIGALHLSFPRLYRRDPCHQLRRDHRRHRALHP